MNAELIIDAAVLRPDRRRRIQNWPKNKRHNQHTSSSTTETPARSQPAVFIPSLGTRTTTLGSYGGVTSKLRLLATATSFMPSFSKHLTVLRYVRLKSSCFLWPCPRIIYAWNTRDAEVFAKVGRPLMMKLRGRGLANTLGDATLRHQSRQCLGELLCGPTEMFKPTLYRYFFVSRSSTK